MNKLFEKPLPSVAVRRSSFGGGWVWGLNEAGSLALVEYFQTSAAPIPGEDRPGWIVEPQDGEDLAAYLQAEGIEWELR
jgi:hypothetical protein